MTITTINNSILKSRSIQVSFIVVLLFYAACFMRLPEFFQFTTGMQGSIRNILQSQIFLDDDVMITLRTGHMLSSLSRPQFNVSDIAQPSTSYIAPYIFFAIDQIFSRTLAPAIYALIVLGCSFASFWILLSISRSVQYGIIAVGLFIISATFITQGLKGWDHFIQGFFLTYSTSRILTASKRTQLELSLAGLSNALAVAARPDSIVLSVGLCIAAIQECRKHNKNSAAFIVPFLFATASIFVVNYLQFATVFPTPVRLKALSAQSVTYAIKYLVENTLFDFSSGSIFIGAAIFIAYKYRQYTNRTTAPIILSSALTGIIAIINSDVFLHYRMLWSPALILVSILMFITPARSNSVDSKHELRNQALEVRNIQWRWVVALCIFGTVALRPFYEYNLRTSIRTSSNLATSQTAQQYIASLWITANLNPHDGSIGLFYAGTGYHLSKFEIADLLGKADEKIAQGKVKWGPPGHNKWDIDVTLARWTPQAIILNSDLNPFSKQVQAMATRGMEKREDYAFFFDLILNEKVQKTYSYCVLGKGDLPSSVISILIRNDIMAHHQLKQKSDISCFDQNTVTPDMN